MGFEPPPTHGERCGRCGRFLAPGYSVYRDRRLGSDYCMKCVGEILDEKCGLTYVPAYRPRGRP